MPLTLPSILAFSLPGDWDVTRLHSPFLWQLPWMLPAAAGIAMLVFAAVIWLYPRQVRRLRWPWRWVLPGLRVLALVALAISLARPIALLAEPANVRGPVYVLIDRSRSMSAVDMGRKHSELVALADGMGLLPQNVRAEATAKLSGDFEQLQTQAREVYRDQGELEYARVAGRGIAPAEQRLHEAADAFFDLARALAARSSAEATGAEGRELRQRIKGLDGLARDAGKGGWATEARRRLGEISTALTGYQSTADRRLYEVNADVRRICDALDRCSRFDLVRTALLPAKTGLIAKLGDASTVQGFAFADDVTALGALHPAPPASTPSLQADAATTLPAAPPLPELPPLGVEPDGRRTNLTAAVAALIARADGHGVRGIVVFSDGRQVGRELTGGTAALASAGIPVFTVAASTLGPREVRDLSFSDVVAPRTAFVGETILVRAALRGGALGAEPASVRLKVDDGPERSPDRNDDTPPDDPQNDRRRQRREDGKRWADFALKIDEPGAHRLTLSFPPVEGEATTENNQVQRWVKVLPQKIRVAAYAGTPGWDFQYLRGALGRRPWFEVDAGVLDPASPKFPLRREQILQQDVIILADVPVGALDQNQWDDLKTLVTTRGGSVLFLAGDGFSAAPYVTHAQAGALMPFVPLSRPAWRVWPGERPSFRLLPDPRFDRPDVLRLEDGDSANRRWDELPGLFRVIPLTELKPGARPILIEPGLHAPVLAEMRLGVGRTFFFGANETWRWRLKSGEHDQERFWLQLVRCAADEPYAVRADDLALDTDRLSAAPGETVHVRARVFDDSAMARKPGALHLEVTRDGRIVQTLQLSETIAGSGRFHASVDGLSDGDYQVELIAGGNGGAAGSTARRIGVPLHVHGGFEAELADVSADTDRLRRLAESTGGEMLRLDQLGQLPERIASAASNRPGVRQLSLWDSPYLFVFVLACLGAEWALRKRFGLA